jgi:hypothetical protein
VTGTAKQHVADDYVKRIYKGITTSNSIYGSIISKIAGTAGIQSENWSYC